MVRNQKAGRTNIAAAGWPKGRRKSYGRRLGVPETCPCLYPARCWQSGRRVPGFR